VTTQRDRDDVDVTDGTEPALLIYREEVLAIIGAFADIVVELRQIRRLLENEEEEEGPGSPG
jgi:hypothetical protein